MANERRSCKRRLNPDDVPSSSIAAGIRLMTMPSDVCDIASCASSYSAIASRVAKFAAAF